MVTCEDRTSHSVVAILDEAVFDIFMHNTTMTLGKKAGRVLKTATYEAFYADVASAFLVVRQKAMEQEKQVGHYFNILPCTINNTFFCDKEFRYNVLLRY